MPLKLRKCENDAAKFKCTYREEHEVLLVVFAHTVVHPRTMVVHTTHATLTHRTVVCALRFDAIALRTLEDNTALLQSQFQYVVAGRIAQRHRSLLENRAEKAIRTLAVAVTHRVQNGALENFALTGSVNIARRWLSTPSITIVLKQIPWKYENVVDGAGRIKQVSTTYSA